MNDEHREPEAPEEPASLLDAIAAHARAEETPADTEVLPPESPDDRTGAGVGPENPQTSSDGPEASLSAASDTPSDPVFATPSADETAVLDSASDTTAVAAAAQQGAGSTAASAPAAPVTRTSIFRSAPAEDAAEDDQTELLAPVAAANSQADVLHEIATDDSQPRKRRGLKLTLIFTSIVVVIAGLYVGACALLADRVPREVSILGQQIGGLSSADATAAINALNTSWQSKPIDVVVGETASTLDPAFAGLAIDAEATLAPTLGFTLDPRALWTHIAGADLKLEPVIALNETKLDTALTSLGERMNTTPVDATVTINPDGTITQTPAQVGYTLDQAAAATQLKDAWLTSERPLELAATMSEPELTQAEADAFRTTMANPLVAALVTVQIGDHQVVLTPDRLAAAATVSTDSGDFVLTLDPELIGADVLELDPSLQVEPVDARFTFSGGVPAIVPSSDGVTIDKQAVTDAIMAAIATPERVATSEPVVVRPELLTTEYLESLGVNERIVQFSTPLTSEPIRTRNIARAAELITGTLVLPGGTFDTMATIGPITIANGYVEAGMVVNGIHIDGVGGGLSQIGTTTFNAGFLAGYQDVEHHTHSYWFRRYPPGQEATLSVPHKNVVWTNDTPYGALLNVYISGGQVVVEVWSTKYWDVNVTVGPKRNIVPIKTEVVKDPKCEPYGGGEDGFTITVSRTKTAPDGTPGDEWQKTTTYKPDNAYTCG